MRERRADHPRAATDRGPTSHATSTKGASPKHSARSLVVALAKLTGIYITVALVAVGAVQITTIARGHEPASAREASILATALVGPMWIYAIYRVLNSRTNKIPR